MCMDRPLVSIGLPVYNGEPVLRRALDSLVSQSYEHLEIIISDNASTDGTGALCREYAARDPRIRYAVNDTNIGVIRNFRRVFERSTGEYFLWMGADDVRPPTAVGDCLEKLRRNERAVMVHGPIQLEIPGGAQPLEIRNEVDLSLPQPADRIRAFTRGLQYNAMLFGMYRRSALSQVVIGRHYGQDYLVCLKMCLLGPVEYVASPMIQFRHRVMCPLANPMHAVEPLTVQDLLFYRGPRRNKCWTVLPLGCYYILTCPGLTPGQRLESLRAHGESFVARYRNELASELPFLLTTPAAWMARPFLPAGRRLKAALKRGSPLGA